MISLSTRPVDESLVSNAIFVLIGLGTTICVAVDPGHSRARVVGLSSNVENFFVSLKFLRLVRTMMPPQA